MTTVAQLQAACRSYGLPVSGNKAALRDRLASHLVRVEKGDLRITRRLGAAFLKTCLVPRGSWRETRHWGSRPTAWLVPAIAVAFGRGSVPVETASTPPGVQLAKPTRAKTCDDDPSVFRCGL